MFLPTASINGEYGLQRYWYTPLLQEVAGIKISTNVITHITSSCGLWISDVDTMKILQTVWTRGWILLNRNPTGYQLYNEGSCAIIIFRRFLQGFGSKISLHKCGSTVPIPRYANALTHWVKFVEGASQLVTNLNIRNSCKCSFIYWVELFCGCYSRQYLLSHHSSL